jgi:hypothetical protein
MAKERHVHEPCDLRPFAPSHRKPRKTRVSEIDLLNNPALSFPARRRQQTDSKCDERKRIRRLPSPVVASANDTAGAPPHIASPICALTDGKQERRPRST